MRPFCLEFSEPDSRYSGEPGSGCAPTPSTEALVFPELHGNPAETGTFEDVSLLGMPEPRGIAWKRPGRKATIAMSCAERPATTDSAVRHAACQFLLGSVLVALSGCSESVLEYTKFGSWSQSPKEPVVFSGSPSRDAAAHGASLDVLTEHDWKVLEKIAPKPIWERLAEARRMFLDQGKTTAPPREARPDPLGDAMKLALDVPATRLPDGQIQMYYPLRHYGGVGVVTAAQGGTDRRTVTLAPANLAPLLAIVTAQLAGKGTVAALPEENTLVITCAPEMQQSVLTLLAGIDVPPRQVEITAKIFEVKHDFDFQIGAETLLQHMGSSNTTSAMGTFNPVDFLSSIGTASGFQGGVLRLLQVFEKSGITIDTTLQMLADTELIKMVASPRMTVTAGRTGYVLAGQELPIQDARIANEQIITEKTTYKPVGVQLYITPQVIGPETVKLHVVTAVSAVAGFSELSSMTQTEAGQGLLNPVLDSREAETFVTVDNESTLVIGGLRMIRTITRERKMPGLGDIPLVEWFFKSHRSQNHVSDLYFFLTPHVIRSNRPPSPRPAPVLLPRLMPEPLAQPDLPALPPQPLPPAPATPPSAAPATPPAPAPPQPAAHPAATAATPPAQPTQPPPATPAPPPAPAAPPATATPPPAPATPPAPTTPPQAAAAPPANG